MEIKRKIDPEIKEILEDLMDDAEDLGKSFIELKYGKPSKYLVSLRGRESLALITGRENGTTFRTVAGGRIIKDGAIKFFPDTKNRCWGYMLDTENNRQYLAGQLKINHVIIADRKIKKEIYKLAEELGLETEVEIIDHSMDNYIRKTRQKKQNAEERRAELVAELAALDGKKEKAPKPKKKTVLRPAKKTKAKTAKTVKAEDKPKEE